jgi:hypothetical protein
MQWHTLIIPATHETEIGGMGFGANISKNLARPYLKNKPDMHGGACL